MLESPLHVNNKCKAAYLALQFRVAVYLLHLPGMQQTWHTKLAHQFNAKHLHNHTHSSKSEVSAAAQSHLRPVQTKHQALTPCRCPAVLPASTQVSHWHHSEPQTAAPQPGPSDPCHCWWVGALTFAGHWRLTRRRAARTLSPVQLPLPWQGWSSLLHSCAESRHCCWCHRLQQELCRGQRLAAQGCPPKLLHFCADIQSTPAAVRGAARGLAQPLKADHKDHCWQPARQPCSCRLACCDGVINQAQNERCEDLAAC